MILNMDKIQFESRAEIGTIVTLPRAFLRTGGGVSHFPKNSIDKISGQAKQGAVYYIYI